MTGERIVFVVVYALEFYWLAVYQGYGVFAAVFAGNLCYFKAAEANVHCCVLIPYFQNQRV